MCSIQLQFIYCEKRTISTIVINDVVIVANDASLFVVTKGKLQDVKKVAKIIKQRTLKKYTVF